MPTVTNTDDSGAGSLREAILVGDSIGFAIGTGPQTIQPLSPLPPLTSTLDARTQPGWSGTPLITIDGSLAGSGEGLLISGPGLTVAGMTITGWAADGICLPGHPNTTIVACVLGGNGRYGCIISEPTATGNRIIGGWIGCRADGTPLPNTRSGILVYNAPHNWIGGFLPGEGNLISGGARHGVNLDGSIAVGDTGDYAGQGHCHHNIVAGNTIMGNGLYGVVFACCQNNVVAGVSDATGNTITGNGSGGILLFDQSVDNPDIAVRDNLIAGNRIESNNGNGVIISSGTANRVERCTIRYNVTRGIYANGPGAQTNVFGASNVINSNLVNPQVFVTQT